MPSSSPSDRPERVRPPRSTHLLAAVLCVAAPLAAPASAGAQTMPGASVSPRLTVTLLGGWASFAHKSVNDVIHLDNLVLTAPADSGGVGLDEGLTPLTDGIGLGAELSWRLGTRTRLIGGVMRLADSTRKDFTYDADGDPGTPAVPGFLFYEVSAYPVYAGIGYGYAFTEKLDYELTGTLIYFPASKLLVEGALGGPATLDEEGTASGVGFGFSWGGHYRLTGPWALAARVSFSLGQLGDAKKADGTKILDVLDRPLGLDWSGVDILLGITWGY